MSNKILIHKQNGKVISVPFLFGLKISFKGKNSTVNIYEPCKFKFGIGAKRSHIKVLGDNNVININQNTKAKIKSLRIRAIGSNNYIDIGKNLEMTDDIDIDFACTDNLKLKIGDDCLFGQNIKFMLGDHHNIYSKETNEKLNIPQKGITIGNNVWLARNVSILKDVTISDNSVVAYGSIVTKEFEQSNILIGGIPAKILKENIKWNY